jgi:hypothetical protein
MGYQVRPYNWTACNPGQKNVSIAASTALTIPSSDTLMADIVAVGGPAYFTYDGVAPTSSSYHGTIASGAAVQIQGIDVLARFLIIGTSMSVSYFK